MVTRFNYVVRGRVPESIQTVDRDFAVKYYWSKYWRNYLWPQTAFQKSEGNCPEPNQVDTGWRCKGIFMKNDGDTHFGTVNPYVNLIFYHKTWSSTNHNMILAD